VTRTTIQRVSGARRIGRLASRMTWQRLRASTFYLHGRLYAVGSVSVALPA